MAYTASTCIVLLVDQENSKRQHYLHVEYLNAGKVRKQNNFKSFPENNQFQFRVYFKTKKTYVTQITK
jgi:hypothetical protein